MIIHKAMLRQGNNGSLIAGVLVVLLAAGLCRLLWLSFHAPLFWIAILAWLVVPLIPFAMVLFAQRWRSSRNSDKGLC